MQNRKLTPTPSPLIDTTVKAPKRVVIIPTTKALIRIEKDFCEYLLLWVF